MFPTMCSSTTSIKLSVGIPWHPNDYSKVDVLDVVDVNCCCRSGTIAHAIASSDFGILRAERADMPSDRYHFT